MLRKFFRIQYANSFSECLKPCAPYLAIFGPLPTQLHTHKQTLLHLSQWDRVFCLDDWFPLITAPAPIHILHPTAPAFFCEKENVAVVGMWSKGNLDSLSSWSNKGAQICAMSRRPLYHPGVRLWIHGSANECSHHVFRKTLYVGNSMPGKHTQTWMEFPTIPPQELEAEVKRKYTLLRLENDDNDNDIHNCNP